MSPRERCRPHIPILKQANGVCEAAIARLPCGPETRRQKKRSTQWQSVEQAIPDGCREVLAFSGSNLRTSASA